MASSFLLGVGWQLRTSLQARPLFAHTPLFFTSPGRVPRQALLLPVPFFLTSESPEKYPAVLVLLRPGPAFYAEPNGLVPAYMVRLILRPKWSPPTPVATLRAAPEDQVPLSLTWTCCVWGGGGGGYLGLGSQPVFSRYWCLLVEASRQ